MTIEAATPTLTDWQIRAIEDGYRFECPCGELCRTVEGALFCRKCRTYSYFPGRYVIDIAKDEVVYGTLPTDDEVRWATEEYISNRKREEEELAAYEAEYAADMLVAAEKVAAAKVEASEDALYWLQDSLMGIRTR